MYAIIRSGGKQYKVQAGDTIRIEKVDTDPGKEIEFNDILMVGGDSSFVGAPIVDKAKVKGVVTAQSRAPKIIIFKKKRRQGYRRTQGHRQCYTEVCIHEIVGPDGKSAKADLTKKATPKKATAKKATTTTKKVTAKKTTAKKAAAKTTTAKKTTTKKTTTKKAAAKKTTTKKKTTKKATTTKKKVAKKKK